MRNHNFGDNNSSAGLQAGESASARIIQRLVKYLAAKDDFLQVALITAYDGLRLEIFASGSEFTCMPVALSDCAALPVDVIRRVFNAPVPAPVSVAGQHGVGYIYPLLDDDKKAGVLYVVSHLPSIELEQRVSQFASIHYLLTMTLLQAQQEREKERLYLQRDRASQALQFNEIYLKSMMQYMPALLTVVSLDARVLLCSDHLAMISGATLNQEIAQAYPKPFVDFITSLLNKPNSDIAEQETNLHFRHDQPRSYGLLAFPLRNDLNEVIGICAVGRDISARKQSEMDLQTQQSHLNDLAYYDSLTRLPNRTLFDSTVSSALIEAKRHKSRAAMLLLDLDRFKNANDSLGHDIGDELLKNVAKRLQKTVRERDTVARIGGDEFAVLIEDVHDLDDVDSTARKILRELSQPLTVNAQEYLITASLGVSVFPDNSYQSRELLKYAEVAMYEAKASGKNQHKFYAHGMNSNGVDAFQLENDLRRAIDAEQLFLLYQPQVDMETGALVGVEALVRWQHPKKGLINPVHFIPMAEETGLIVPLGQWVIRAACLQQRKWLAAGFDIGKIAVNISAKQLSQPDFVESVKKIFRETDLAPEHIEFEITENSAMETASDIIGMLTLMNAMGLSLAIDDFGTGYSSLAYLKRFPVQKLKIDRSFIDELVTDVNDAVIAQSIIGLAHNMQLQVIAEGVENTDQQDWLIQRGCRLGQGFLYSQPVTHETIESKYFNSDKTKRFANDVRRSVRPKLNVVTD